MQSQSQADYVKGDQTTIKLLYIKKVKELA